MMGRKPLLECLGSHLSAEILLDAFHLAAIQASDEILSRALRHESRDSDGTEAYRVFWLTA